MLRKSEKFTLYKMETTKNGTKMELFEQRRKRSRTERNNLKNVGTCPALVNLPFPFAEYTKQYIIAIFCSESDVSSIC